MFNHGLTSAGMFFLVGVVYDRTHTRQLDELGGLWAILPRYGAIFVFTAMAALGLPGLNGFVSEFLVVRGAWHIFPLATALSMIGLFLTGVYILKAIAGVLHGPRNDLGDCTFNGFDALDRCLAGINVESDKSCSKFFLLMR